MKIILTASAALLMLASAAVAAETEAPPSEDPFPTACAADAKKFCASASTDSAKWDCIGEKIDEVSAACQKALGEGEAGSGAPSNE
jgi:hypothetical protein